MAIMLWFNTFVARFMATIFLLSPGMGAGLAPAPAAAPAPRFTQRAAQELKVMSFNIWYGGEGALSRENRLPWVADTILSELPDVAGLQEANDFWRAELCRELKEHYAIAGNFGRDNWLGLGEGSPILYLKDKYRLVSQGVFWLKEFPFWPGAAWEANTKRITAWALLQDKSTGFSFLAVNTHMDHQSALARANGAALITNFINKLNLPTVLAGDMNCTPSAAPILYFEGGGLIDTARAAESAQGARTFHGYGGANPATGEPIDYVFANGYLERVANYRVLHGQYEGHYPSDHFAVVSELTLKN